MTPRRRPDDDMVEVVLEGEAEASRPGTDGADGEHAAAPAGRRRRGWRPTGRRARALASVVAVAVAAVAVVHVVTLRGKAERRAAFAAVADVVTDLDEPIEQVWEIEAPAGGTLAGDLALVAASSTSGAEIRAFDAATGAQRWAVDRGTARGVDWCEGGVGATEAPVVVCWSVTVPDGEGDHGGRLVALDARDGSVITRRTERLPDVGYGTVGDDVVLGNRRGPDVVVRRVDPLSGTERWSTDLRLEAQTNDGSFTAWIDVRDERYVVVHGPTTAVLSAEDGRVLGTWHATAGSGDWLFTGAQGAEVTTSPIGFGVWADVTGSVRGTHGRWYDADGDALGELDGFLAEPALSDGSRPDVVLTQDDATSGVRATDVRSGEELWSTETAARALARRDGVVVLAVGGEAVTLTVDARSARANLTSADRLVARDLVSGEEVWTLALTGVQPGAGAVTDGRRLVVVVHDDGRALLAAVDLEGDGVRWRAALPPSVTGATGKGPDGRWLRSLGPAVVAEVPGRLVGLG